MRHLPALILVVTLWGCASSPSQSATFGAYEPPPELETEPLRRSAPNPGMSYSASPREFAAALRFIEAVVVLEKVRKTHPDRHEATYNEAMLIQEYGQLIPAKAQDSALVVASRLYRLFLQQAAGDPSAAYEIWRAREKLAEIDGATTCILLGGTEREREADRKRAEQEAKQQAAEEELDEP